MYSQRRLFSFLEVAGSRVLMYFISLGMQLIIFPLYGMNVPVGESAQIAFIFMCSSIFWSYLFRRFFNWLHSKGIGVVKDGTET